MGCVYIGNKGIYYMGIILDSYRDYAEWEGQEKFLPQLQKLGIGLEAFDSTFKGPNI